MFQVSEEGLWDGRPSLGGVWVASPDAKDPERVIIRNPGNGKFVIGALFRRERENPGPKIQISSDAAAALGLLAGQPGQLNITALRRDEAPVTAPDATQPALDTAETVATETPPAEAGAAGALDTGAVAAAIDKADGTAAAGGVAAAGGDAATIGVVATAAVADPAPKKRHWWQRDKSTDTAQADAPVADGTVTETPTAVAADPGTIVAAPLTAPAPVAASPATSGKSLIQLGIFSVEANAKRAADMVTKAGSTATVRKEGSNGKPYWSVVAGPANTAADRAALMKRVKGLGFTDAYFVSR